MPSKSTSPVKTVRRDSIPLPVERQLYGRSAGRCEFEGCNRFMLEHHVTHRTGNFAEKAHIVAYSPGGPRADASIDKTYLNSHENLMFLCPACHKQIDENPEEYTVEGLKRMKRDHEERVYQYTDVKPGSQTRAFRLQANVRGQRCVVTDDAVRAALAPRYFETRDSKILDLTGLEESDPGYWKTASERIARGVRSFVDEPESGRGYASISVFAIARIPLLVSLGSKLSTKVPASVYNRQVLADDWTWSSDGKPRGFTFRWISKTDAPGTVLLISLSGNVPPDKLPESLASAGAICEIGVEGGATRECLATEASLKAFRSCFLGTMREIRERRGDFAIVPAMPVAASVCVGRDMLKDLDPPVAIYDWNGSDGYEYTLTVNDHDND